MILPERVHLSTPEHTLTGVSLVGSDENDRIRITSTRIDKETTRYEVAGVLKVGRSAISAIMATPLHYPTTNWEAVRDGLRDVATPSRRVNAVQRNAEKRAHLKNVGPAARELAAILTNNQSTRTQSANIPIYTATESLEYTNDEILRRTSAGKLVMLLKSVGIGDATARQLSEFAYFSSHADEAAKEIEALTGLSDEDIRQAENRAMLSQVDTRVWAELAYRLQERMFIGFTQQAMFRDNKMHFGDDDKSVFILESDVPDNIAASKLGVSVELVRKMRDPDRKTGRDRYQVDFLTNAAKVVAQPTIVWEKQGHRRRFVYPVSEHKTQADGTVARNSSLLGAALAANYGRLKYGISYSETLNNRLYPRKDKPYFSGLGNTTMNGAGFLPLVINHQEATLLKDDYFTSIEDAIK